MFLALVLGCACGGAAKSFFLAERIGASCRRESLGEKILMNKDLQMRYEKAVRCVIKSKYHLVSLKGGSLYVEECVP